MLSPFLKSIGEVDMYLTPALCLIFANRPIKAQHSNKLRYLCIGWYREEGDSFFKGKHVSWLNLVQNLVMKTCYRCQEYKGREKEVGRSIGFYLFYGPGSHIMERKSGPLSLLLSGVVHTFIQKNSSSHSPRFL